MLIQRHSTMLRSKIEVTNYEAENTIVYKIFDPNKTHACTLDIE